MSVKIHLVLVTFLYIQEVYSATKLRYGNKDTGEVFKDITEYNKHLVRQSRHFQTDDETERITNRNDGKHKQFTTGTATATDVERAKRRVEYREPLQSIDSLSLQNKLTVCAVDTKICDCYIDRNTNRSNINCRYKNLYTIPEFTPIDTVYYEITFSANNYISRLPYEAFKNLKVERINLLNNKISTVQAGAFLGLTPYLRELMIEGNGVNGIEIPFASMSVLTKLRRLKVKNFKQDSIPDLNYFGEFPDLEALEFDTLSLSFINKLAFKNKLSKLLHLDFQYVEFNQIPVESLSFLPSLSRLYIRFTKIDTIYSESFVKLTNLLDLDLSFNQIETLGNDAFLGVSHHLTHLDLGSNKLPPSSLSAISSKSWTNLKHLTLSYNEGLTLMPANVFKNMPNLEELFIVNLNLVHISRDLFTGLNNLLSLDLGWNNIESIQDGAFQHMNKLYELKLEYQFNSGSKTKELQLLPGAFKGLEQSLIYLYLERTTLNTQLFWTTISMLKELQHLALSDTKLNEIPNYAFRENSRLNKIELSNNSIQYLHQAAFKGLEHSLIDITLNDNQLSTISDCVFKNFTKLDNIHLLRNPLLCDCRLKWLHDFIIEKSKTVQTFLINDFICKQPQLYANKPLHLIPRDDLICTNTSPERCIDHVITTDSSNTGKTSLKTTTQHTNDQISLQLRIVGETSTSIAVAWSVLDKSSITGFKLEYKLTTQQGPGRKENIHRDEFTYTINNLLQGQFYLICITAEINGVEDQSIKSCRTTRTFGQSSEVDEQNGNKDNTNSKEGDNRNVIIGAIIATIAVVVLIAIGVCAVVKYKVQGLKELQFAMHSTIQRNPYVEDGMKVCVVPNEYSEIDVARLASKYKIQCPKTMQRQFGVDNSCFNSGEDINPYNTYQKIGKGRRKNPYENDEEEEEPVDLSVESDKVHYKNDLVERHSAPSRLDAADLKSHNDRNSRPLPATPADQNNQKRSSTLKPVKKVKPVKKQPLVTKVSVYNTQEQMEKPNVSEIHDSNDQK